MVDQKSRERNAKGMGEKKKKKTEMPFPTKHKMMGIISKRLPKAVLAETDLQCGMIYNRLNCLVKGEILIPSTKGGMGVRGGEKYNIFNSTTVRLSFSEEKATSHTSKSTAEITTHPSIACKVSSIFLTIVPIPIVR
ncbi:hypothetical protein CEXT_670721 [Caerostris extrusa]|uniref:Uncharacterized protein n=1 Tax=Caerostris extrusa TaxID=172846 RepID=A0AAV4U761_CAEEX|nr:hypothetical protein CEXT_670721 [Caerostris extrusa]